MGVTKEGESSECATQGMSDPPIVLFYSGAASADHINILCFTIYHSHQWRNSCTWHYTPTNPFPPSSDCSTPYPPSGPGLISTPVGSMLARSPDELAGVYFQRELFLKY